MASGGCNGADSSFWYYNHQPPPPLAPHHPPPSYATAPPYPTAANTADYSSSDSSDPHLIDPSFTLNLQSQYNNPTKSYPSDHPPYCPPTLHRPYSICSDLDPSYSASFPSDDLRQSDDSSGEYGGYGFNFSDRQKLHHDRGLGRKDDDFDKGVYTYDGANVEAYEARGTSGKVWSSFDDYGRVMAFPQDHLVPTKQQDVRSSVHKFCVRMLPDGGSQGATDVICQIGLDGIRILDPSANKTLRIYPLETITRWEVNDASTYTFWSKSSADIEPRCIRLQSNSHTTNSILDTVAAATIQLKEMGGRSSVNGDSGKVSGQTVEKKKGVVDWMNIIRPSNEEKHHWVPDDAVSKCTVCEADFGAFIRKHHCRNCGDIFCDKCTYGRIALTNDGQAQPVRVCDRCLAEVTQRLSLATGPSKRVELSSHEQLAKKLQEEMEKKSQPSSGLSQAPSGGSGARMKEVACPTCTVHLQVQVPDSGSKTVQCEVCQHPFLVGTN